MSWDLLVNTWRNDLHEHVWIYLFAAGAWGFIFGMKLQKWSDDSMRRLEVQGQQLETQAKQLLWRALKILNRR